MSLGFYLPLFLTVGFSLNIDITVTVSSLCNYRAKLKEKKQFESDLKTIDPALVEALCAQGFNQLIAQRAVIATGSRSEEEALRWAMEHATS